MRYFIVLLIVSVSFNAYSITTIDSVRYNYAKKAPANADLEHLVKYLKKHSKSDRKTVETFFYWIAQNIEYSYELKNKADKTPDDVSVDSTLINKKTVCAGYANLLLAMCTIAKIECVIVQGIAQNYIAQQKDSTNHSWNAVKIDKKWELVDATWGSGGSLFTSEIYEKKLALEYLFADPNFMIIDHFPMDKKWQLIYNSITLKQFQSKAWDEKRFRKFNGLLDDKEYKAYLEIRKNMEQNKNDNNN